MVDAQHSSSGGGSSVSMTRSFDVSVEGDLLKLLQFIRRGPVPQILQAGFRDAVIDYSQTKDPTLLDGLVAELTKHNVLVQAAGVNLGQPVMTAPTPVTASSAQPIVAKQPAIGAKRPRPVFGATARVSDTQAPSESVSKPTAEPSVPAPTHTEVKKVSVTSVEPAVPNSVAEEPGVADGTSVAVQTEIRSEDVTLPEAPSVSEVVPEVSSSPANAADPLTRIKEIKKLINEKVGNPVNLIDANNEVGREYMNALLNAMKVINGGTPDEVTLAMDRLEKAFATVEESISSGETVVGSHPATTPRVPPTPDAPAATAPAVEPSPAPAVPAQPAKAPISTPASPVSATPATPATPAVPPVPAAPPTSVPRAVARPTTTPTQSVAATLAADNASITSQAAAKAAELAKAAESTANDPLQAGAITDGLKQLLAEWKLFKGSGIFGTGPSGIESELYKTLAPLPMAAVIANRFEGATPEVKQSIADYMNGWRYEQTVVHEMNETFEHYLRRVIKAILDRKNPTTAA